MINIRAKIKKFSVGIVEMIYNHEIYLQTNDLTQWDMQYIYFIIAMQYFCNSVI